MYEYVDTTERVGYAVETLRREGWTPLLTGHRRDPQHDYATEAVSRAVAILFGMEDHG